MLRMLDFLKITTTCYLNQKLYLTLMIRMNFIGNFQFLEKIELI